MPVNFDNQFGGRSNPAEKRDVKALELAGQLDAICVNEAATVMEAIRYMGKNTRETLKLALEMADRKK